MNFRYLAVVQVHSGIVVAAQIRDFIHFLFAFELPMMRKKLVVKLPLLYTIKRDYGVLFE